MDIVRRLLTIYGDVQGVGFRYRAEHAAAFLGVTGWVRNKWDDTVEMEGQGTPEQISELILMVNKGRFVNIRWIDEKNIPLVEDEWGFRVIH